MESYGKMSLDQVMPCVLLSIRYITAVPVIIFEHYFFLSPKILFDIFTSARSLSCMAHLHWLKIY